MSLFTSSLSSSSIMYQALDAFGLDFETDISVKSESWGVMVTVLVGEHKGVYDFHADNNLFIAA
tara:strand:+ start:68 stop:259 length:192 start_codon:yes stop_codon:yes gene_type:complete